MSDIDIHIPGFWVSCFLIYWVSCYVLYFGITWISFGMHPLFVGVNGLLQPVFRCLLLPITLPVRLIYHWRHRGDPIIYAPVDPGAQEKTRLYNDYLKQVDKIDAEARGKESGNSERD